MNEINEALVLRVAELAQLNINPEALPELVGDLENILNLVNEISNLDASAVEPMAHPHECTQTLRPDQVTETDQRNLFQASGPQVSDGLYQVPKVIP